MSLKNALAGAAGASAVSAVLQLVNGILLARMLGPEGRGLYGELAFWAMTVNGLTNFAIYDAAIIRLRDTSLPFRIELGSLLTLTILTTALNALVLVVIGAAAMLGYINTDPSYTFEYIAYGIVVNIVFMLAAVERSKLEFSSLALERVLTPASYTLLLIFAFIYDVGVRTTFILLIAANFPVLILRLLRNFSHLKFAFQIASLSANMRLALRFFSVAGILVVVNQIDKAIVIANFDTATTGQYLVAFSLAGAGYGFVSIALQTVMLPSMVNVPARTRTRRFERTARVALTVSLGVLIIIVLTGSTVISLAFGKDYAEAGYFTIWVGIALCLMPLMSLMETANMALVRNWYAIELHVIMLACLLLAWALGILTTIEGICVVYAVARILAVALGMRHLIRYPLYVKPSRCLLIQREDVAEVLQMFSKRSR